MLCFPQLTIPCFNFKLILLYSYVRTRYHFSLLDIIYQPLFVGLLVSVIYCIRSHVIVLHVRRKCDVKKPSIIYLRLILFHVYCRH